MVGLLVSLAFLGIVAVGGLTGFGIVYLAQLCLGPNSTQWWNRLHFKQPPLWVASLELAQWPGCNRVELFAITRLRENACKLPVPAELSGDSGYPVVQISTLDSFALLPVMSRAAYSFFMALQA